MKLFNNFVFSLFVVFSVSVIISGQEKLRTLERRLTKNDPVDLINFEINNKIFDDKKTVLGNRFWLRDLRINVRNMTNKPIIYVKVNIQIDPREGMKLPVILPMIFGSYGIPSRNNPNQLETIPPLLPNQVIKMGLAFDVYEKFINSVLPENQIDDLNKVKYYLDFVAFDDGTGWQRGQMMRRNPNNPKLWDSVPTNRRISENVATPFYLTPFLDKMVISEHSFFLPNTLKLQVKG